MYKTALTIMVALVLGLSACKPEAPSYTVTDPKTGEKTKISVTEKGDQKSITVSGAEGKGTISVTTEGDAPKNLPAFIPAYPGAKHAGSFASDIGATKKDGAVNAGMVSFTTPDSEEKVLAFYKDAFTRAGLKDVASGNFGNMKMISFTKGEKDEEGAQVIAVKAETGETQVQVMYNLAP